MTTLDELERALTVPQKEWLAAAKAEPDALETHFARAGRKLGRDEIAPGWTAGEAGRALLLADQPAGRIRSVYERGDATEKLAVLKALPLLDEDIGDQGVPLLLDALRTNDTRLVAEALGPYARHLDAATWRQGVIKCVFMGIPLDRVSDLDERTDAELIAMLRGLAEERQAAGRDMSEDATALLEGSEKR
jgi:hypothetical protein